MNLLRLKDLLGFRKFLGILVLTSFSGVESQDLKKEIQIPFPDTKTLDESILLNKKKSETIIEAEKKPVKNYIVIPFPNDKNDSKESEIEFKKIDSNQLNNEEKTNTSVNKELPLEKLFVFPEIEITDSEKSEIKKIPPAKLSESKDVTPNPDKPKVFGTEEIKKDSKPIAGESKKEEPKTPKDIGKALLDNKKEISPDTKTTDKDILKKSKLYLGDYAKETKEETPKKEPEVKKTTPKKTEAKTAEVAANTKITNLPNSDKLNPKKGKDKKKADESEAPFERSKYYLNRDDKPSATPELNTASSSDGEKANLAKMDQIRLLALDRKKNEAKNIIEGISEPEYKFKGLYELAVGLENSAKGDKKLQEEAIPFLLTIITEAPKTDKIVPKSLWALSHLLFKIGDHTPALDHLSEIILKHSNSEYIDESIYLSGRIYEESTSIRNLSRAKKYYQMFINNANRDVFINSVYLPFVKKRLELLEN